MLNKLLDLLHIYYPKRPLHSRYEDWIQYAIVALSLLACIPGIFQQSKFISSKYNFHSLLITFIVHSISFGFQRALKLGKMEGIESAVIALSSFIMAGMAMRRKGQLGGLVIIGGGVAGILWGMKALSIGSPSKADSATMMNAAKMSMAIASPMLIFGKAILMIGGSLSSGITKPALLLIVFIFRLIFGRSKILNKILLAFLITNLVVYVAEVFAAVYGLVRAVKIGKKIPHHVRHSARLTRSSSKKIN